MFLIICCHISYPSTMGLFYEIVHVCNSQVLIQLHPNLLNEITKLLRYVRVTAEKLQKTDQSISQQNSSCVMLILSMLCFPYKFMCSYAKLLPAVLLLLFYDKIRHPPGPIPKTDLTFHCTRKQNGNMLCLKKQNI